MDKPRGSKVVRIIFMISTEKALKNPAKRKFSQIWFLNLIKANHWLLLCIVMFKNEGKSSCRNIFGCWSIRTCQISGVDVFDK